MRELGVIISAILHLFPAFSGVVVIKCLSHLFGFLDRKNRQTDGQTERHTERQTDTHIDRQTDR